MNQLWTKWLIFALVLLVATAPPPAIGQTPAPPAPASTPVVEIPPGQEGTFPVEGARNGGRLLSAKSADPSLVTVDVIDTASFTGLDLKCAAGKTGVAAITYTWRDAAGKEQTSYLVVACGIKIAKSVTTTIAPGEATTIEAPTNAQDRGHGATSLFSPNPAQGRHLPENEVTGAGIKLAVDANFPEGIYIFSYTFRSSDGQFQEWIITMNVARKRVSQLIIPNDGLQQVVSQPSLCPAGSPYDRARSGMATTFTGYVQRTLTFTRPPAGDLSGFGPVFFATCLQPSSGDSRQDSQLGPFYSLGVAPVNQPTEENMRRATEVVASFFRTNMSSTTPLADVSSLGTGGVGMGGRVALPDGRQVSAIAAAAYAHNVVFWGYAQQQGQQQMLSPQVLAIIEESRKRLVAEGKL